FIALIEHGEHSGNLIQSLRMARMVMERQDILIKACLSALTYPIVIAVFASALTLGLMTWVMPQIIPLLKSLHVALPLLTLFVIYASEHIISYGLLVATLLVLSLIIIISTYVFSKKARFCIQYALLQIIIIGQLYRLYHLSLMFRSLGTLISSGHLAHDAYIKVTEKITLLPVQNYFLKKIPYIDQGFSISSITTSFKKIPKYAAPLISAGEVSGSLGSSLLRVADIIDRDIEHSLKRMTALIEPLMMIGVGSMIGAIALSIMMPIYEVSKVLQH
ncbi:MAG: type II secretion system F family protein, partial [Candidatus Pacebacteria bacterium]|nr:type II secretion system F family protein [Candidatus Paceibacterota bacterium]